MLTFSPMIPEERALQLWIRERVAIDAKGCWIWQKARLRKGYGLAQWRGKTWRAHRLSYFAFKDDIPDGFDVDHLCSVRDCVNPGHLEAVPPEVNKERRRIRECRSLGSYCKNGHPLTRKTVHGNEPNVNSSYCGVCVTERRFRKSEDARLARQMQEAIESRWEE